MSTKDPSEKNPEASRRRPEVGFLGLMRSVALIAVVAGAVGSLVLMLRAGQRTPWLLLILFIIWVLSPFVALLCANMFSKRWSFVTRATLYCVTIVTTLGSFAIYDELVVLRPAGSANAFLFVIVPPASWVVIVIVVSIAALMSGRLSRRAESKSI